MSLPNVDLYFDSGLIPSLSEKGGVGHHALMGRPILPLLQTGTDASSGLHPSIKGSRKAKRDTRHAEDGQSGSEDEVTAKPGRKVPDLKSTRPRAHRRTSSLDDTTSASGAVSVLKTVESRRRGSESRQDRSVDSSHAPRLVPSMKDIAPGQLLHPPTLAHSTSVEIPTKQLRPPAPPKSAKHARSSSWSAPLTSSDTCIPLNPSSICTHPTTLLTELVALIPPSRLDPLAPPPSSSTLHAPTLLAGLAFVLEALVAERTILSSSSGSSQPELPLLRNKTSLQLPSGPLDWSAFHIYLSSFGPVLRQMLTLILSSEVSEGALDLVEMVKAYISKIRKVFGEVAGMYMDKYSFVGGWWDENGMRGGAREVGGWGEMVDEL